MAFTNDDYLPTYAELEVEEIPISSAPLRAAAHHLGKYCDTPSKEFMLCKAEEKDPRKCLNEGKEVTKCGLEFLRKVKGTCAESFTEYWKCLDHAAQDMRYPLCRATQKVFDNCMKERFGQERPELGHFSRIRIHETKRPKPVRNIPMPEPVPEPPGIDDVPVPESVKYGTRMFYSSSNKT